MKNVVGTEEGGRAMRLPSVLVVGKTECERVLKLEYG